MPLAYLHLPDHVKERRQAFADGVRALGFSPVEGPVRAPVTSDDLVITWNLTARSTQSAQRAREQGAAHIVVENGYVGLDQNGWQYYAMALDGHCGSGRWYAPDDSRLKALQIEFQPWKLDNPRKVLVAAQRGIGSPQMRSPSMWAEGIVKELAKRGYEGRIRPHPGANKEGGVPFDEDVRDVGTVIVWSSNCATKALIRGIPVFYAAPFIITAGAAAKLQHLGRHNFTDAARYEAFSRLAWAQWTLAEISSGEAIDYLLQVQRGALPACRKG